MTVSELIKDSKSLRKGFKFKYLCTLILSILIAFAYFIAFLCILETTKICEKGLENLEYERHFFAGYEHLFDSEISSVSFLPNTDTQNEIDPKLDTKNNSSDSTTLPQCHSVEHEISDYLQKIDNLITDSEFPATTLIQLIHTAIVNPILTSVLSIGLILVGLERALNQKFSICSLLKPLKRKWHLLAYYYITMAYCILVLGLVGFLGIISANLSGSNQIGLLVALLLALIPLYYYFTHVFFAGILIYTKNMKAVCALKTSHKMVSKNLKLCGWFSIIYVFQIILGSLLLLIPLFWILPKFAIAYGLLFNRLSTEEIPIIKHT